MSGEEINFVKIKMSLKLINNSNNSMKISTDFSQNIDFSKMYMKEQESIINNVDEEELALPNIKLYVKVIKNDNNRGKIKYSLKRIDHKLIVPI